MLTLTLPQAIAAFERGVAIPSSWHTREGAEFRCGAAAWAFETWLGVVGIPFEPYAVDVAAGDNRLYHVMTRVGDVFVDWTARQFGNLPFPAVWTQCDLDAMGWRDLDEDDAVIVAVHESAHRFDLPMPPLRNQP